MALLVAQNKTCNGKVCLGMSDLPKSGQVRSVLVPCLTFSVSRARAAALCPAVICRRFTLTDRTNAGGFRCKEIVERGRFQIAHDARFVTCITGNRGTGDMITGTAVARRLDRHRKAKSFRPFTAATHRIIRFSQTVALAGAPSPPRPPSTNMQMPWHIGSHNGERTAQAQSTGYGRRGYGRPA